MFKNKYLKQLQDVQSRIKNHKATIANLKMPTPSCKISRELCDWLEYISCGESSLDILEHMVIRKLNVETFEYLERLGNYFVNIADYERSKSIYNDELRCLKLKESRLKEKLGID